MLTKALHLVDNLKKNLITRNNKPRYCHSELSDLMTICMNIFFN